MLFNTTQERDAYVIQMGINLLNLKDKIRDDKKKKAANADDLELATRTVL